MSFQLKISVTFWTRRRALCEESSKTLFSPLLLGVCCSVETFYEIVTMVLITPWSAETVRLILKKSTFFFLTVISTVQLFLRYSSKNWGMRLHDTIAYIVREDLMSRGIPSRSANVLCQWKMVYNVFSCKYRAMLQLYTFAFPQQGTTTEASIFAVSLCTKVSVSSLSLI